MLLMVTVDALTLVPTEVEVRIRKPVPGDGVMLSEPRYALEGDGLRLLPCPMDALFAAGSHYSPLGNRAVAAQRAQSVPGLVAPTSRTA
jgi:hypothetical protein